jgi:hypothetical protein
VAGAAWAAIAGCSASIGNLLDRRSKIDLLHDRCGICGCDKNCNERQSEKSSDNHSHLRDLTERNGYHAGSKQGVKPAMPM